MDDASTMKTLPKKPQATKRRGRHPDKALSAAFCRTVAESGRYADGNGLYLHVDPSGARRWVQRLVIRGRSRGLGLGSYALVSLAEARELALANRKLARAGGDPLAAKQRTEGMPSFEEASEKVVAIHGGGWKDGGKSAKQWRASLREYAYARIGDKGVDQVTTADVMAVVLPIWTSKHETAQRVRWRISAIMKWAIAQGYRSDNPAGEAIAAALPKRPVKVRHMPALPYREVSGAIAAVHASRGWVGAKLAFEFQVLTVARSSEVRLATWGRVRHRREDVDDSGHANEGATRAPRAAVRPGGRDPARSRAPEPGRRRGRAHRSRVPGPARQAPLRRRDLEAGQAVGHCRRPSWLPLVVPGLGRGTDQSPAGGHRGGAGTRRPEQGGGGLRPVGPVRAAAADGRLGGAPRRQRPVMRP